MYGFMAICAAKMVKTNLKKKQKKINLHHRPKICQSLTVMKKNVKQENAASAAEYCIFF